METMTQNITVSPMEKLTIGGIDIDFIRKDIKNMHLAVYPPTGRVRLAVPTDTPPETARLFAISKIRWIRKHQQNFVAQERQSPRQYKERESHYFQGRRYLLRLTEVEARPQVVIKNQTHLDLFIRPNSSPEQCQAVINEWYRAELKTLIPPMITKWEQQLGVSVAEWHIKLMKTRWGTCNIAHRRIWLNLELAKKPVHCLEYVVLHEMVHLLERHHNDRFVGFMNQYMPQWKFYKEELNRLPIGYGTWDY